MEYPVGCECAASSDRDLQIARFEVDQGKKPRSQLKREVGASLARARVFTTHFELKPDMVHMRTKHVVL